MIVIRKYKIAFAALTIVVLAAVAVSIGVLTVQPKIMETVPEFKYSEPLTESPTHEESGFPSESPYTDAAADPNGISDTLLTSNNPSYYMKINFNGFDIFVSGICKNHDIVSAHLASDGESENVVYDGDSFSVALTDKHANSEYDTLYIFTENGLDMGYRIFVTEEGFTAVDVTEAAERNDALAENAITLPEEGVIEYIAADGNSDTVRSVLEQVREISDTVCDGLESDYDKLLAISQWVSENIYYDFDSRDISVTTETISLENVLETHRTVCGGFANLFSALCAAQGITCYNFRGTAITSGLCFSETDSGEFHEWNCAVIDGQKIWIDTVWNTSNTYVKEAYYSGKTGLKYFDITTEAISLDHCGNVAEYRDYFFNV